MLQAGTLHAEEHDYKTAYSYFYEAFEGLQTMGDARAVIALKYMLLSKIMMGNVRVSVGHKPQSDDVGTLLASKHGVRYQGRELESMRAIARAHRERSLELFEAALVDFAHELRADPVVSRHIGHLADQLLER